MAGPKVLRAIGGRWVPVTLCPPRKAKGAHPSKGRLRVIATPMQRYPSKPYTKLGKA